MKKHFLIFIFILSIININAFSVYIIKSSLNDNEDKIIQIIKSKARFDYILYDLSQQNLELSNIVGNILLNKPDAVLLIGDRAVREIGTYINSIPIVLVMFNSIPDTLKRCNMICGVNNNFVNDKFVQYLKNKFPTLKKMGIIFEVKSSIDYARYIKNIFEKNSIMIEFANINNINDLPMAVKMLKASSVDMLWLGNDSIVLNKNNFEKLSEITLKEGIPIISTNGLYMKNGVFASIMYDIESTGINAANVLIRLNNGELPKDIGFVYPEQFKIALNKNLMKKFKIKINTGK